MNLFLLLILTLYLLIAPTTANDKDGNCGKLAYSDAPGDEGWIRHSIWLHKADVCQHENRAIERVRISRGCVCQFYK